MKQYSFKQIYFSWSCMGYAAYVPFLTGIILIIYCSFIHGNVKYMVPALEMILPVMSAWWSIFLFQDVLEEEGSETLFTYPSAKWILFIPRLLVFFSIFIIFSMITLFIILGINNQVTGFYSLLIQLGAESFFFTNLGFISIILTRNVSWSLYVVAAYTSFQIITRGTYLSSINVFIFNDSILSLNDSILVVNLVKTLLLSIILLVIAQLILNKTEKFH